MKKMTQSKLDRIMKYYMHGLAKQDRMQQEKARQEFEKYELYKDLDFSKWPLYEDFDFSFSRIENCTFGSSHLPNTSFIHCEIENTKFDCPIHTLGMGTTLYNADFTESTIKNTTFEGANLNHAIFKYTQLIDINFRRTNLYRATFSEAKIKHISWPAPTMVLLANWERIEDRTLLNQLMNYDRVNLHNGTRAFELWEETSTCPFLYADTQRTAVFHEEKDVYQEIPDDKIWNPLTLMEKILTQKTKELK